MTIELLDKSVLTILNRNLKYPLAVTEKDYFLALISKIIYTSPLKSKLVFKGGTALYHTYLPQLRFSEDLDFSTNTKAINVNTVKSVFHPYDFLSIKKDYFSKATYKIERLLYTGPLAQPNSIKIEIDFLQNVILPPKKMVYRNEYGVKTNVMVMDIREITAEKIRAMNDRIRYRDYYDFSMIIKNLNPDLKEVIHLVRQKEIRKPINAKTIRSNWQMAKRDLENDLQSLFVLEKLDTNEIEKCVAKLNFAEITK